MQNTKENIQMLMDRSLEDMRNKIREQVEQGIVSNYPETMMEFEPITTYSLGQMGMPGGGDYAVVSDIDSHAWYSFAQASQHNGSSYVMRHSDDKVLPGNWNIHYTADGHPQQGVPYLMRSQMISSSGPYNGTLNQSSHPSASGPGINRSNPSQPSYQIYSPFSTSNHQNKNIIKKPELNEEEQTRLLENIPTSSSSSPSSSNENTNTTLQQKGVISNSNSTPDGMCHKQSELNSNKKPSGTPTVSPSTVGDDKNVNSESAGENRPLPTFEQAFGSTEIGRYSHEGIFSGTQHNTQHQGPQVSANNSSTSTDWNNFSNPSVITTSSISATNPNSTPNPLLSTHLSVPMYESNYQANYTYYSYMTEYNYSYNHLNSWSGGIRYDDPLNGY
ncbi:Protein of unknown function [Gryllus bimaculatus]|nr:Protein of unknown function [Gryllus bimaculatus]